MELVEEVEEKMRNGLIKEYKNDYNPFMNKINDTDKLIIEKKSEENNQDWNITFKMQSVQFERIELALKYLNASLEKMAQETDYGWRMVINDWELRKRVKDGLLGNEIMD
jgi:hypothetical protein